MARSARVALARYPYFITHWGQRKENIFSSKEEVILRGEEVVEAPGAHACPIADRLQRRALEAGLGEQLSRGGDDLRLGLDPGLVAGHSVLLDSGHEFDHATKIECILKFNVTDRFLVG